MVLINLNFNINVGFMVLIAILYYIFFQSSDSNDVDLIVGILSKRDNFENRKILRKTWFNYINYIDKHLHKKVKAFFIIGKQCPIPIEYREDFYSCEEILFNSDEDLKDSIKAHSTEEKEVFSSRIYNGISFKVLHPIIVSEIGILCSLINNQSKILLTNPINEDIIVEFNITEYTHKKDDFCFSNLSPHIQLPKNFYAAIKTNISNSNLNFKLRAKWNNQTTIIKPLMVYHGTDGYLTSPYTGLENLAVSFLFKLADVKNYNLLKNSKDKINKNFLKHWIAIDKLLEQELQLNDIILVDAVDTYRNLTNKLLHFMQWSQDHYNYKYFLKTDDDCYLDLISIVDELKRRKFQEKTWWGKNNWFVNLYGKWADPEYPSILYPAFACGSGHVISSDLIKWITVNLNHLHRYQGEDVSLGIWLTSILPTFIQDDRWFCGEEGYDSQKYSIGQLNSTRLIELYYWKNIQNGYKLDND